ncbi:hypothetical protein ABRY23_04155 [Melioribacteraceae bacterium 4301-Me]|uniref:hypothetical protein n=1 Tax=Pyranulibacter aquaticus TaxID=3163344 RepID=UPI0035965F32
MSIIILRYEISRSLLYFSIIVGLLIRLSFISTMPIGSDDVYRYMWDGKVQAHGINPYLYTPDNSKLNYLHSELLPASINFKNLKTVYFPLSQWFFLVAYSVSGESIWGYKLLLFICELFTIIVLLKLINSFELKNKLVLFYALCPLPIIQFAVDSHLDGFGLPLLILSIFFYAKNKKIIALIFLGLSLSIKPVGLMLIPILFLNEKKWYDRIKAVLIPSAVLFVQFLPYMFTANPFEGLFIFAENWTFNGSAFQIINYFINNNQVSRIISGFLLLLSVLPIYLGKLNFNAKIYYAVLLLLIFSPVVHPWYITWLAVLLPIYPAVSGVLFASLSSLTAVTIMNYQLYGIWKDYWQVLTVEYTPVIIFLIIELIKLHQKMELPITNLFRKV